MNVIGNFIEILAIYHLSKSLCVITALKSFDWAFSKQPVNLCGETVIHVTISKEYIKIAFMYLFTESGNVA